MADAPHAPTPTFHEIPYLRLFPWLRLFTCAQSACDPKRLMLAAAGLLLTYAGFAVVAALRPDGPAFSMLLDEPLVTGLPALQAESGLSLIQAPYRAVIAPFTTAFRPAPSFASLAISTLAALWALAVWSLTGAAIARVSAIRIAKGERLGLTGAVRFSARKAVSVLGAVTTPLLGILVIATPLAAFGLLYRVGASFGPGVAGALAFLPLMAGVVLTIVILAPALGWPLTVASVAVEDSDAFDAVSRTYAYVYQRPWHFAGFVALAAAIGTLGLLVVGLFEQMAVALTVWGLSLGGGDAVVSSFGGATSRTHAFWLGAVALLVRGWAFSFFWTSATATYLLLRRDVDGTPISNLTTGGATNPQAQAVNPAAEPAPAPDSAVPAPHASGLRAAEEATGV